MQAGNAASSIAALQGATQLRRLLSCQRQAGGQAGKALHAPLLGGCPVDDAVACNAGPPGRLGCCVSSVTINTTPIIQLWQLKSGLAPTQA